MTRDSRPKYRYGFDHKGEPIVCPSGWRLLPEGEYVPHVHREFTRNADDWSGWCASRRCHSTMTPVYACVWGWVLGIAVPVESTT